jgi:glutamyl/glutaminyl-tRNA synthetase
MINTLVDPQTPRTFILRIEDTDQKRLVGGAIDLIIDGLKYFEIEFDEGPLTKTADGYESVGDYGPYIQTQRRDLYDAVAKYLVEQDHAYPCFLTEEEIDTIRKSQELQNKLPGVYWAYSTYRHTSDEDIIHLLEENKPHVIRLKNTYGLWDKVSFHDLVKWDSTMWAPHQDTVLVKSDWIPVYHLAAMVDDWLMWVTHIMRADEWFASIPLHLYISSLFNPHPPQIAHPGPLLKLDGGNRRKLSKRKDPEADVHTLLADGYNVEAIINYLANIINSGYEDWWMEDNSRHYRDYPFSMDRVNSAGAIVDMVKANAVSQDTFARFSDEKIYESTLNWAKHYHPEYIELIENNKEVCLQAIGIERHDGHDPKRFITYQDVVNHCRLFIDSEFGTMEYPQEWTSLTWDQVSEFINTYLPALDLSQTKEVWFEQLKSIGGTLWYAATNGEFKAWWYQGKVGDLAMILRVALCKSPRTPDLYETMRTMGIDKVKTRLQTLSQNL